MEYYIPLVKNFFYLIFNLRDVHIQLCYTYNLRYILDGTLKNVCIKIKQVYVFSERSLVVISKQP